MKHEALARTATRCGDYFDEIHPFIMAGGCLSINIGYGFDHFGYERQPTNKTPQKLSWINVVLYNEYLIDSFVCHCNGIFASNCVSLHCYAYFPSINSKQITKKKNKNKNGNINEDTCLKWYTFATALYMSTRSTNK